MNYKYLLIILLSGFLCFSAIAQQSNNNKSKNIEKTINTQQFDPEIASQQYLQSLSDDQKEKSDAYFEGGYWLMLIGFLVEIVIAWIFLSLGLSNWIRKIVGRFKNTNIQNFIYLVFYFLLAYIITFPLTVYRGFIREHKFDLSNLSFGGWFKEELIGIILMLIFGGILLTLVYWVIRKTQKNWWIWASGIVLAFFIFSMFIGPVFISLVFNEYKP